jgi:hypothetical protein
MDSNRKVVIVGLVFLALAGAGYSFYATFMNKPGDGVTPEQRAKAYKTLEDFQKNLPSTAGTPPPK